MKSKGKAAKDRLFDNIVLHGNQALLERSRINGILSAAMGSALVVVTAGAGYGKTRAIHSFFKEHGVDAVWVQLSGNDNAKSRFWEHFCHAVGKHMQRLGTRLASMGFPDRARSSMYRELIAGELSRGGKYAFVFDDCHLLTDRDVLWFVGQMADLSLRGGNATTVVISRTEPGIDIMPLIMRDKVSFITEDDLRFTKREIEAFFYRLGIDVGAGAVADIYDDTQGWAFSVNLISLSLKKAGANDRYARTAMRSNVFKLMESEVFSAAPESLRRFLVRLSLVEHLSAALVDSLADSPGQVAELESASSFIRYDNYLNAYRIHHLFLDFLAGKQGMLPDSEKRDTWRMAGAWCRENGFKLDAMTYYERSGDYCEIIDIMRMDLPQQIPRDTADFLLGVMERAPSGAFDGALLYHAMHMRVLMSLGRVGEAEEMAREVAEEYGKKPETRETCRVLSSVYAVLGVSGWMSSPHSDSYDFDKYFVKEFEYYKKFPFEFSGPSSSQSVPLYACIVGTEREGAIEEYIDAVERSAFYAARVMNGCMAGIDLLARGELHFYKADLNSAEVIIKKALAVAAGNAQHDVYGRALYYLLRIHLARGSYEGAAGVIGQFESLLENEEYQLRQATFDIVASGYYSLMNRQDLVAGWLGDDFEEGEFGEYVANFANLKKAWLFYNNKRYEALLGFVRGENGIDRYLYGRIELKILEALCLYQMKDKVAAFGALEAAYRLSLTNGLSMPFIETGKDMRTLTAAAKRHGGGGIPGEWLDDMNRRSATYAKRLSRVVAGYRNDNGMGEDAALSPRETEVLSGICSGLSRTEVAARLGLSINTVKAIMNIVYTKLGARNTADVIRIAIEKKLIRDDI